MACASAEIQRVTENSHGKIEYFIKVCYQGKEWSIRKRYSDFARFDHFFRKRFECSIELQLPPKKWWTLKTKPSTLAKRQKGLQKYLDDVLTNSVANEVSLIREFLEVDENLLAVAKKESFKGIEDADQMMVILNEMRSKVVEIPDSKDEVIRKKNLVFRSKQRSRSIVNAFKSSFSSTPTEKAGTSPMRSSSFHAAPNKISGAGGGETPFSRSNTISSQDGRTTSAFAGSVLSEKGLSPHISNRKMAADSSAFSKETRNDRKMAKQKTGVTGYFSPRKSREVERQGNGIDDSIMSKSCSGQQYSNSPPTFTALFPRSSTFSSFDTLGSVLEAGQEAEVHQKLIAKLSLRDRFERHVAAVWHQHESYIESVMESLEDPMANLPCPDDISDEAVCQLLSRPILNFTAPDSSARVPAQSDNHVLRAEVSSSEEECLEQDSSNQRSAAHDDDDDDDDDGIITHESVAVVTAQYHDDILQAGEGIIRQFEPLDGSLFTPRRSPNAFTAPRQEGEGPPLDSGGMLLRLRIPNLVPGKPIPQEYIF